MIGFGIRGWDHLAKLHGSTLLGRMWFQECHGVDARVTAHLSHTASHVGSALASFPSGDKRARRPALWFPIGFRLKLETH